MTPDYIIDELIMKFHNKMIVRLQRCDTHAHAHINTHSEVFLLRTSTLRTDVTLFIIPLFKVPSSFGKAFQQRAQLQRRANHAQRPRQPLLLCQSLLRCRGDRVCRGRVLLGAARPSCA